jgi:tryptophan synthase beta chain
MEAFEMVAHTEGIIPALESAHAFAHLTKIAPRLSSDSLIVVNLSGRGDKDVETAARELGIRV